MRGLELIKEWALGKGYECEYYPSPGLYYSSGDAWGPGQQDYYPAVTIRRSDESPIGGRTLFVFHNKKNQYVLCADPKIRIVKASRRILLRLPPPSGNALSGPPDGMKQYLKLEDPSFFSKIEAVL